MKRRTLPQLEKQQRFCAVSFRALERIEGEAEDAPVRYEMTISSEAPVDRWFGREILSHEKSAIDTRYLKAGLALLREHYGDPVGIEEEWELDTSARKIRTVVRFSRSVRGKETEQDVADGILRHVSVGYIIVAAKLVKQGKTVAEDEWLVTRWMPVEASLVGVPADITVGVGRSAEGGATYPVAIEGGETAEEERTMCKNRSLGACQERCICTAEERAAAANPAPVITGGERNGTPAAPATDPAQRNREMADAIRTAEANGIPSTRIAEWMERGLNPGEMAREILRERASVVVPNPAAERIVDLDERSANRYSYARAISRAAEVGVDNLDGLEREVHDDIAKRKPTGYAPRGGLFVPLRLRKDGVSRSRSARALASNAGGAGSELVVDQPGEMIELLRNTAALTRLGGRVLANLHGPVVFPKQTSPSTLFWVGENSGVDVAESQIGMGVSNLSPKTAQATTGYSRQLLAQSDFDTEALVRDDLAAVNALGIDRVGIHGIGAAGQPMGIYNVPGVQVKALGGSVDYDEVVDMTAMAADKNALVGTLGWLMTPKLAGRLKTKPLISGAAAGFIWMGAIGEGEVAGYRAISSNQISSLMSGSDDTGGTSHGIIFANWADCIIGMWAAMELIVDPYAKKKQGLIEVTSFIMADVLLRHEESFVKGTGASLA